MWKNVKSFLKWNNNGPPSKLLNNGKLISSPAAIAEIMNQFFVSKVSNLRSNIPASDSDALSTLRKQMENRNCTFSLKPVHPDQVLKVLCGLKNSKATGMDYLDSYIIKLVAIEILPAQTLISQS